MRILPAITCVTALALAATQLGISAQSTCMPGHNMPAVKDAGPPQKMTGIGNASIDITTTSPEARIWFLQGLNLLHDFWDYESVRAFEQSVKADPDCAMCWWGLAQASSFRGGDDAKVKDSLQHAKKLSKHTTEPEKLYIKAAIQGNEDKGKRNSDENAPHKDSKETRTLRKLVALSPGDTQAKILLAGSLRDGFKKNHEPRAGSVEGDTILVAILKEHPDDSAANHYWIHAMEPGNHPEYALESSRKLGSLAPASGHMVHMPGHIFYRTGDYEAARASFGDSLRVDEAYMDTQHVSPNDDWNYAHNMMYFIAGLLEEGRIAEATEVSAKLSHAHGDKPASLYVWSTRDGISRLSPTLPVVLRSGNWPQAITLLQAADPGKDLPTLLWLRDALLAYTRGMNALTTGDTAEASKEADLLKTSLTAKPAEPMSMPAAMMSKDLVMGSAHSFIDIASLELQGSLLTAQNKPSEADAAFKKASEANEALGYHEPPSYIRPVGETRGDALLRAGRYNEARLAYEDALKDRPNSGFALYGLAQVAVAAHDQPAATAAYQRFLAAWAHADTQLPQLAAAQAWVQVHTPASGE